MGCGGVGVWGEAADTAAASAAPSASLRVTMAVNITGHGKRDTLDGSTFPVSRIPFPVSVAVAPIPSILPAVAPVEALVAAIAE